MTPEDLKMKEVLEAKISKLIDNRAVKVSKVLDDIEGLGHAITDYIIPTSKLYPYYDDINNMVKLGIPDNQLDLGIHEHAIVQFAGKVGIPSAYLNTLASGSPWERKLASKIMADHNTNTSRNKVLVRSVDGQVRGYLSDKYKRIDSLLVYESFLQASMGNGACVVDGYAGETKSFLEVIMPQLYPVPTKNNGVVFMCFGAQIRNSDFGDSKLDLKFYSMQAICLNGAIRQSVLSAVHLGKQIHSIELSKETMALETQYHVGVVKDSMSQMFSKDYLLQEATRIQKSSEIEVDIDHEIKKLPKATIYDEEKRALSTIFINRDPNDGIQGKTTLWSLSQGIATLARNSENEIRKRELAEISGKLLDNLI